MNATALAYLYLSQNGGSTQSFSIGLNAGMRVGKAFSNALSLADSANLVGTDFDPFYSNDPGVVIRAIKYLDGLKNV